jgi:hypothetical protein
VKHFSRIWLICVALAGAVVWTGVVARAGASDWQGQKLPNIPINFIVGYGSLINSGSRNSTASAPIPAIPVRVLASFGYIRSWNERSPSGFTALGLRKPKPGESGVTINGVLYPVEGADMSKFDDREAGYVRVEVPMSQIEAVGWQRLPEMGHFWIYVPVRSVAQGGQVVPGEGLPEPDANHPLLQSYIDVVVEGGLEYGSEFAREIIETSDGWSHFWLNDRELAHRPWVHDPKAATVDALLTSTSTTAALLPSRVFPEMYGESLRAGSVK